MMMVIAKLEGYGARQMDLLVSSPHLYANDQSFLHQAKGFITIIIMVIGVLMI